MAPLTLLLPPGLLNLLLRFLLLLDMGRWQGNGPATSPLALCMVLLISCFLLPLGPLNGLCESRGVAFWQRRRLHGEQHTLAAGESQAVACSLFNIGVGLGALPTAYGQKPLKKLRDPPIARGSKNIVTTVVPSAREGQFFDKTSTDIRHHSSLSSCLNDTPFPLDVRSPYS